MKSDGDLQPADVLGAVVAKESVLAAIEEAGGIDLQGLVAATPYSKSTLNRTVNEFADSGLIRVDAGSQPHVYHPTFLGCQLLAWVRTGRTQLAHASLVSGLPAGASLPAWVVAGGSVVTASEAPVAKQHVLDQVLDLVTRSDSLHVVAPTVTQDAAFHHVVREALEGDTALEAVVPSTVEATIRERFADLTERLLDAPHVDLHPLEGEHPPYAIGVGSVETDGEPVERAMAVVCYDEGFHGATGSVVNDSPSAVAWADAQFEAYRARARRARADQ